MFRKLVCLTALGLMLTAAGTVGAQPVGQGKVLVEYWFGGAINNDVDTLKADPDFPDKSERGEWRDGMDCPDLANVDYFGARARAFLTPAQTGDYTFWTASDDDSELWLSTDADPANAVMIANVEGWTNYQDWTGSVGVVGPNQKSAPVPLVAGQTYYIEMLFADGTGGGHGSVAWAGPGLGEAPTVLKGDVLQAFIRDPEPLFQAHTPDAPDGAVDVINPLFTWKPGITAAAHEVYFGTNPEPGPGEFRTAMPLGAEIYFHVPGLTPGETYFWRVDEVDAAGNKYTGNVWSFTAMPLTAHFPSPYDGALWRSTKLTVSWTAGQGAVKHKVYGSTEQAAVAAGDAGALLGELAETSLDASALLEPGKTYYWRVDEVAVDGTVSPGPVWTFSTVDPAGGAVAEYWNNTSLSGAPVVVTTVPEVNFNWPDGSTKGTNSPDAAINTNNFSCRWTADLNVPVSGTYRLYDATDDGGRLFLNGKQIAGNWVNRGTTEDASAEIELVAGGQYQIAMEMYESGGGAAAFLRWSSPGIPKEVIPQGALQIPKGAISPSPANNAVDVSHVPVLTWTAGAGTVQNLVYLGTDEAKVAAGDASLLVGTVAESSFVPAALTWNTTYFWKVDNVTGAGIIPGVVWTFKTADFLVVNLPQVTLAYDNTVAPFVSERAFDVPADWTMNGVTDLALRFQGRGAVIGGVTFDAGTGAYAVTGAGADIWGTSDQFTYAFKTLTGDATIIARVTDKGTGNNNWAKGGVMVRQSLAANSAYALTALTSNDGNGGCFQWRPSAGASAAGGPNPDPAVAPPYWVKLERVGNVFTASLSADGAEWKQLGTPQTIEMTDPVYIGLEVTSHDGTNLRTFGMDNVSTTGNIPEGAFTTWRDIGMNRNWVGPLYAALQDAAGATAVVVHPNPAAVNITGMTLWRIPTSAFAGVDLKNVAKLFLGVGNGQPDGIGSMNFADIRVLKPVTAPAADAIDVTIPGDAVVGQPNDNDWPAAEVPANVIDDKSSTKFLHFKGDTGPSGIIVTPAIGATVVTGLAFTSANDAAERDPATFELYGSNKGANGPWGLIAKGAIDDFTRPIAWPRRTKGVTPIGFANAVPYTHYKVMFPTLRGPGANSMQIAEIELLGTVAEAAGPVVFWVSFHGADDAPSADAAKIGFTEAPDKGYTDLLKANGYTVVRYVQNNNPDKDMLAAAADLVIVSRSVNSGSFQNAAASKWNGVAVPLINVNGYTLRKNRLGWITGNTMKDTIGDIKLAVNDPAHPIFAGIALTDGVMTNPFAGIAVYPTDGTAANGISVVSEAANANGTVLATMSAASGEVPAGAVIIAEWPAGAEVTHDGGDGTDVLAGPRLMFLTGSRENGGKTSQATGIFDLHPDGAQILLNAVAYMIPPEPVEPPPPTVVNLLANGGFETGTSDGWNVYGNANAQVVTEVAGAAVAEGVIEGKYCLYVDVPAKATNFWEIGLQPQGIVFQAGKKYTFSVYLKAKAGTVDINMKPELAADPWTGFGEKMVTVTEQWTEFSVTTPVFAADTAPAGFTFHIGNAVGGFWVDGMRYYEGDYVAP